MRRWWCACPSSAARRRSICAGGPTIRAVFSVALAGGGVKGGQVYGSSDKQGGQPKDGRMLPPDLHATIYHLLHPGPHRNSRQPWPPAARDSGRGGSCDPGVRLSEQTWLESEGVTQMVDCLYGKASDRLCLLGCACCRKAWSIYSQVARHAPSNGRTVRGRPCGDKVGMS